MAERQDIQNVHSYSAILLNVLDNVVRLSGTLIERLMIITDGTVDDERICDAIRDIRRVYAISESAYTLASMTHRTLHEICEKYNK